MIIKNVTNSNHNVTYLINNDPIFFTIITNELKNNKNEDDNDIDIVTNVIRDSTNYKILLGNKILKESDLDEMKININQIHQMLLEILNQWQKN